MNCSITALLPSSLPLILCSSSRTVQNRVRNILRLRRQSFLLRRETLAGEFALYQSFIEVSQPLVKQGFPTLEGLQLSLRLFAVKLSRLLSCLQEPVYADGVLSVDLY